MNIKVLCATSFISGVALGALISFKYAEKYYRNIAEEEIDSVVQQYNEMSAKKYRKESAQSSEFVTLKDVNANRGTSDYKNQEYVDYTQFFNRDETSTDDKDTANSDICKTGMTENVSKQNKDSESLEVSSNRPFEEAANTEKGTGYNSQTNFPYFIESDDFYNKYEDYDHVSLTLLKDGTVLEDDGNVIEDISVLVGHKITRELKTAELKTVRHVCNEAQECCYEIYIDSRTYSEYLQVMTND